MRIGNVEAVLVSDGMMNQDAGGVFGLVPRVLWEQIETPDALNRVPAALNCLLVVSQKKRILIDTGLGDKLTPKQENNFGREGGSTLLRNLARLGFQPEDVDIVIDTHLHADHCGGNTRRVGDRFVPTFSRAEYWVQRIEWAEASYPNERTRGTYFAENFKPLEDSCACLLNGDTRVTDEVKCMVTRGHTRAHQCVVIESQGEKAIFLGDAVGRAVYMEKMAWIPAYDVEPLESLETKRRLRDWAYEENALLIFQHDPRLAFGRMKKDRERWRVEPVEK
jgi:glyoxylase-like metal-dependent hydrolase (beta-lactamase superfamily II)